MIKNFETENFTLVLSGSGALGIAHLGVLHVLEQKHIVPKEYKTFQFHKTAEIRALGLGLFK